jgi:hypothetical protein
MLKNIRKMIKKGKISMLSSNLWKIFMNQKLKKNKSHGIKNGARNSLTNAARSLEPSRWQLATHSAVPRFGGSRPFSA